MWNLEKDTNELINIYKKKGIRLKGEENKLMVSNG